MFTPLFTGLLITSGLGSALGQSYSIDWQKIAGGGVTFATGGPYSLGGTVGQPDASPQPSTGGSFSLTSGFWSIFAVQTPGAPLLSIERQGADVRVFWPLSATGFVLDESETPTGAWLPVAFPYATNTALISISAPVSAGNKFYRLRKQ